MLCSLLASNHLRRFDLPAVGEFNISLNKFPEDVTRGYIFYFADPMQGSYDLSRSTFGPLNADPRIRRQPNSTDRLAQLKLA